MESRKAPTGFAGPLRTVLVLLLALLVPACAPKTAIQSAGTDQEITRAILWEYRKHPTLSDVRVSCSNGILRLEGRLPDPAARDQALRIASDYSRGTRIEDRLSIKPR